MTRVELVQIPAKIATNNAKILHVLQGTSLLFIHNTNNYE